MPIKNLTFTVSFVKPVFILDYIVSQLSLIQYGNPTITLDSYLKPKFDLREIQYDGDGILRHTEWDDGATIWDNGETKWA